MELDTRISNGELKPDSQRIEDVADILAYTIIFGHFHQAQPQLDQSDSGRPSTDGRHVAELSDKLLHIFSWKGRSLQMNLFIGSAGPPMTSSTAAGSRRGMSSPLSLAILFYSMARNISFRIIPPLPPLLWIYDLLIVSSYPRSNATDLEYERVYLYE